MQRKEGFPEENEIVICTVTKIQHHSVFCRLDEYDKSGMLHISEISSGRIRNITEHVKEGKTIICKVLQINKEKGYIDLSLRRVTEAQKKAKAAGIKKFQFAMKLIETAANELKAKPEVLYAQLESKLGDYETVFDLFQAHIEQQIPLPLEKQTSAVLSGLIAERLKPASVTIKGALQLTTYEPNGVEIIHSAFEKIPKLETSYLGGGKYSVKVTAKDYKKAEAALKEQLDTLSGAIQKKTAVFSFARTDR
jgi:translation initiation factor 2 subunit 1